MEDAKPESKSTTETAATATPRRMMAPPKGAPPEAKEGEAKADGGDKKKKKALPPPANPPPQGATSAAAAFRAKSTLPPPNGPPPTGAAPSASVAKIRGAARPPSGAPPPNAAKGPPPASSDAKTDDSEAKESPSATRSPPPSSEPKRVMRPPSAAAKPALTPSPTRTVDLLGDESPIVHDDAVASAPASSSAPQPQIIKLTSFNQPAVVSSSLMRSASEVVATPAVSAPKPKKSTLDVLNDTTATLSRGSMSGRSRMESPESDVEAKRASMTSDLPSSTLSAAPVITTGHSVPFSGSSRPNVPEDEVILVRKQETKKLDDEEPSRADAKKSGSSSSSSSSQRTAPVVAEDDDVEEIPFLEDEAKPDPKHDEAHEDDPVIVIESKTTSSRSTGSSGSLADAKPSRTNEETKPSRLEDKAPRSRDRDDYHRDRDDYHRDVDDEEGGAAKRTDVYDELRKLKRSTAPSGDERDADENDSQDDGSSSREASSRSLPRRESKSRYPEGDNGYDDDPYHEQKDSHSDTASVQGSAGGEGGSGRERREKRREKRRHKHDDEPKRIQAQFFNPKSVPFVPDHLLDFVKRPLECGRGHIIKCFIERNDSGPNKLSPIFTLLLEVNNVSGRPIMYARKKAASRITSHYVISLNKEDLSLPRMMRSHQYIGKLRSSTSMMEYCLYDQGDNPEDLDSDCEIDDEMRRGIRAELAVIRYHNSKKPYPRKMEVVIPSIVENGASYLDWRPISRDQMMEEHMRAITTAGGQNVLDTQNFVFMHKRETKYDPLSSCIVDFRSRATCISVKNFQLVHSEPTNEQMKEKYTKLHPEYVYEDQGTVSLPQEHVLLQLGKVGKHCFNMDFQYPLSMLQAFAISLSRFDSKQR
ncbi:hypothetical protein Poli38472_009362 [Pythium oligandrum]|uniref:Tubby C-terminal domain-containing protein n=1 Tax=Pythium oligandrum TaxID=41045 RepID=A0A8K1CM78_PYTOL|nr:hypothetical protein Poli38472_009362 [Pythium oligandrum]|eukprot:TMW65195.1 hypothetical protein Poli38472_009362 [Pythium oligandrum]